MSRNDGNKQKGRTEKRKEREMICNDENKQ
jgi:hypothetical protein